MNALDTVTVGGPGVFRALEVAIGAGNPFAALIAEVAQKRLALIRLNAPEALWPDKTLSSFRRGKPVVIVIGDDPAPCGRSLGPAGWPVHRKVGAWSKAAMVHGATATADQYRQLAASAQIYGRIVLVECDHTTAVAWSEALAVERTITILPDPNARLPSKGTAQ